MVSAEEGYPLVVLEAMMCGRPVIATEVGGVPDLLIDRVNGLVVPGDVDSIRSAVLLLQRHPEWARGIAAEARKVADERGHARRLVVPQAVRDAVRLGRPERHEQRRQRQPRSPHGAVAGREYPPDRRPERDQEPDAGRHAERHDQQVGPFHQASPRIASLIDSAASFSRRAWVARYSTSFDIVANTKLMTLSDCALQSMNGATPPATSPS